MASAVAVRHKGPVSPFGKNDSDSAWVRVIELQASGEYGLLPEKQQAAQGRAGKLHRTTSSQAAFPWRVLVPRVPPRLRGLLLLNLVSGIARPLLPSTGGRQHRRSSP